MSPLPLRALAATARRTARFDIDLLRHHRRFLFSALALLFVPALYALIYLSSIWDPASHTQALLVAVVNEDRGFEYQGMPISLGDELVANLEERGMFGYRRFADADSARQAVRDGAVSFAVLIPPEFSRRAAPGEQPGAGKLVIYTSEGNNYSGAGFARRFAPELSRRVNQALNTQRWAVVLQTAAGSVQSVEQMRAGVAELAHGADELATGLGQAKAGVHALYLGEQQLRTGSAALQMGLQDLNTGAGPLTSGTKQLGQGVREMLARWPSGSEMKSLRDGAAQLAVGQADLGRGLNVLQQGAGTLRDGIADLGEEVGSLPLVGSSFAEGAGKLGAGAARLQSGLVDGRAAANQLSAGTSRLERGLVTLTDSLAKAGDGLARVAAGLPPDRQLDSFSAGMDNAAKSSATLSLGSQRATQAAAQLDEGLARLSEGSLRLQAGLELLASHLPTDVASPTGSATGLAESVQPVVEVAAPVANQGTAFAPNFVPLALWIGATLTSFLFALRNLPESLRGKPSLGLVLGKLAVPAAMVCGQTAITLAMLFGVLDVQVASPLRFVLTLFVTGLVFLTMIFALVRMLGEAGAVVAMLLLILQLASAGTTVPIELTSPFFQAVHPYLPLTWVVRAMRVTMFGAFDDAFALALGMVLLAGAVALLMASTLGRWKLVPAEHYRPGIEID